MEHLPGHVAGIVRGQEDIAGGHLAGLARPEHGHLGGAEAEGAHLLRREGRGDQWRPDGAWGYGIYPDALIHQGQCQGTGEGHDGPFGGAVVDEILMTLVGGDGGGVDDGASRVEVGQSGLDQIEEGVHIVLKHQGELFPGNIQDAPPDELDGVVVNQNVQCTEVLHRLLHTALGECRIFQIAPQEQAFAAQLANVFGGLLGIPIFIVVGDGHFCPLFRDSVGHRPSNAAVPASNEGHAVGELRAGRSAL